MNKKLMAGLVGISLLLGGCATEQSRTLEVAKVTSASSAYQGQRSPIAVGKFDNRSSYMRGLFSDGVDRLGFSTAWREDHVEGGKSSSARLDSAGGAARLTPCNHLACLVYGARALHVPCTRCTYTALT